MALLLSVLPAAALLLHGGAPVHCPPAVGLRAAAPPRCCDANAMPDAAAEAIPAGQLADAWQRDEKAKGLVDALKGCSIYVVGLGGRLGLGGYPSLALEPLLQLRAARATRGR